MNSLNSFNSAPIKKLAPANDNGTETPPVVHLTSAPASLPATPEPATPTAAAVESPAPAAPNSLQETPKPPLVASEQAPTAPEANAEVAPDAPVEPAPDQQEILRNEAATLKTSIEDERTKLRAAHEAAGIAFDETADSAAIRHHKQRLTEIEATLRPTQPETSEAAETAETAVKPETTQKETSVEQAPEVLEEAEEVFISKPEAPEKTVEKVYPRFETVADDVSRITGVLRRRDGDQLTPFLERNQISSFFAAAQRLQDAQRVLDTNPAEAADAIRTMERALKNFGEVGGGRGVRESSESLRSLALGMNGLADSLTSSKRAVAVREDLEEVRAGLNTLSNRTRSIAEFLGRKSRALREYERR